MSFIVSCKICQVFGKVIDVPLAKEILAVGGYNTYQLISSTLCEGTGEILAQNPHVTFVDLQDMEGAEDEWRALFNLEKLDLLSVQGKFIDPILKAFNGKRGVTLKLEKALVAPEILESLDVDCLELWYCDPELFKPLASNTIIKQFVVNFMKYKDPSGIFPQGLKKLDIHWPESQPTPGLEELIENLNVEELSVGCMTRYYPKIFRSLSKNKYIKKFSFQFSSHPAKTAEVDLTLGNRSLIDINVGCDLSENVKAMLKGNSL